ncbi:MAG: isochorismatase family protein [Gammaproteobacteria bacterium]|nr:isochorismatase family protein [Gammaproteobacteria bacterium]
MSASATSLLNDSVLVVMDIQTGLTASMPMKVLARLQRNTTLLLRAAAALGVSVLASEQSRETMGDLEPDVVRLLPKDARRYQRTGFSLMGSDSFKSDLAASGKRQAVLCGMEAHICVLQTALDLVRAGYETFLVSDAVCSRQRESYEIALARLREGGVVITDAESVLYEWLGDGSHPQLKTLQALIR